MVLERTTVREGPDAAAERPDGRWPMADGQLGHDPERDRASFIGLGRDV